MKEVARPVAQGHSTDRLETPPRPWTQPERSAKGPTLNEAPDDGLSDFGRLVVGKCAEIGTWLKAQAGRVLKGSETAAD